jgi:hypothetical protein
MLLLLFSAKRCLWFYLITHELSTPITPDKKLKKHKETLIKKKRVFQGKKGLDQQRFHEDGP